MCLLAAPTYPPLVQQLPPVWGGVGFGFKTTHPRVQHPNPYPGPAYTSHQDPGTEPWAWPLNLYPHRAQEVKESPFFRSLDWQMVFLQKVRAWPDRVGGPAALPM